MEHYKQEKTQLLYVGSFDLSEQVGGIGIYRFRAEDGATEYLKTVREDIISGCMCADSKRGVLYVTDERRGNPECDGLGACVFAFSVDEESGELTEINHMSALGTMPSYITLDKSGNYLLLCQHSSPNWCTKIRKDAEGHYHTDVEYNDCALVLYPIEANGAIGKPCDVMVFPKENGADACFHSIVLSPDGEYFAACARNQGKVIFLKLDYDRKKLKVCATAEYPTGRSLKEGHSPRYVAFNPTKSLLYFNSEFQPYITTVSYSGNGMPETLEIQNVTPKLPELAGREFSLSDLCVSADGKYLYALYRFINTVSTFRINDETGLPVMIQNFVLEGAGPRGLKLSPDGHFLLVANLTSEDITTLAIGPDGMLKETGLRTFGQKFPGNIVFWGA